MPPRLPLLAALFMGLVTLGAHATIPEVGSLRVGRFPQRMAERWTSKHGLPEGRISTITVGEDRVFAHSERSTSLYAGGRWLTPGTPLTQSNPLAKTGRLPDGAHILAAAKGPNGRLWIVTNRGPMRSDGDKYVPVSFPTAYLTEQPPVNIDATFTSVAVDKFGHVWWGTDAGIYQTDGKNFWNWLNGESGMPYVNVTCLEFGPDGSLWAGTTQGVCRYTPQGVWQYYWGPRWLPNNRVNDIAVSSDGSAWVATDGGVARLFDKPVTFAEKAAHYEAITAARHYRRGYVTGSTLKEPGNPDAGAIHEASDNDGLWTSIYVGAESFRFAVTKDPAARELAWKSMKAMLELVRLTGIKGYPARAVIRRGEVVTGYAPNETVRVPGETDKIWFESKVDPQILCKGDTSSDEMDGHYFAWLVYYDLVANDDEKRQIRDVVRDCTDHILEHDLTLVGHTGRKTRWGVWHPKFINDDPTWWEERGLNALEILAFLKVADHIVGGTKYDKAYRELIEKHHYLLNTVRQKVTGPWWKVNHSDDEMAFMMYWCLLRLEKDSDTRRVLLLSLERSWRAERREASPFFNFIYGSLTGAPCDVEASVAELQAWPWELVEWETRGTHRSDVTVRSINFEGRSESELTRALPASERRVMKWNGNPYQPDGGTPDGRSEEDGGAWLLPYWMGRYYGFITE